MVGPGGPGLGVVGGGVGYCGTAIECGHAVDDARVRLGAGFRWTAVRKMEKGVPSVGADGLPSCTSTGLFLEIDDRGNKRDDCLMNYYWRIAERRGWDGRPVPLGARQGHVGF